MNHTAPRPTVVVAVHDGVASCGSGAGYSNYAVVQILTRLLPASVRLVVLPVHVDPCSREYDPCQHAATRSLLSGRDSAVYPLDNGTGGHARFGGVAAFEHVVQHAAHVLIHDVLPAADPVLILAFDTPFFGLGSLLPASALASLVVVPRSTGRLFAPDDQDRIAWEAAGLSATATRGGYVAALSAFMRHHLHTDYRIPETALVDFPDGLTGPEWHLSRPDSDELLPEPARAGFLLSMGRAQPYKGFDDLLDALVLLREQGQAVPHLLLAAVTDTDSPNAYQQHLACRIQAEQLDVTLVQRFDPDIRRLLAHPALCGVVVPSRAEPFGRIPGEAYAAGAAPVVATTAGGLAEQLHDGITGFTALPADPAGLATALQRGLALTAGDRERMRRTARQFARTHCDLTRATQHLLSTLAPWACSSPATTS